MKSRRAYLLPYFLEMCSKRTSIGASLLIWHIETIFHAIDLGSMANFC